MFALKIGGVILGLALIGGGLHAFNTHCSEKFGYAFFSNYTFFTVGIAEALIYIGHNLRFFLPKSGDVTMHGRILLAIGIFVLVVLVFINFRNTGLRYGSVGTALQLSICTLMAPFILALFIMHLALKTFMFFAGDSSSEASIRRQEQEEREREDAWYYNDVNPLGPNYKH